MRYYTKYMEEFEKVYRGLNTAQKQAVDAIDGPVLVVAGPGTGKTQLLSARVAQILRKTDTLAQNILCLTFTESGAENMRQRLTRFIGPDAYDVAIGTYHAFGGDLIRRYPEYFTDLRLESPVDELGKRQIVSDIVDGLSYRNPLKQTRHHLGDLMSTISEVKRGLLTPKSLRAIAHGNLQCIREVNKKVAELFDGLSRMSTKLTVAEPLFSELLVALQDVAKESESHAPFETLAELAAAQLEKALLEASEAGKTTPLTGWKNNWLQKDADNHYILSGELEARRIEALADVLTSYEKALNERGLYDFDDMILHAINVLQQNDDLRYTLQERYQYVLLDEFQDTNAAQLKLVELLTDNPLFEGRPNVLAVGDDDQAIYAFQGAQYSNMLDFYGMFRQPLVINLSENYRSTREVLVTAEKVAGQIDERLTSRLEGLTKALVTANSKLPQTVMERRDFQSDIAEHAWIADEISRLVESGVNPGEIAILAPKHRFLEPIVPFLREHGIPVRYERRENILEAAVVRQLITMSRLVLALHERKFRLADSLWPEVLSYDFWQFPVSSIWSLSWHASDMRMSWTELLLKDDRFRHAALLFLSLAGQVETETLETLLDRLIGTSDVETHEPDMPLTRSPMREFYLRDPDNDTMYRTITELTVLRARLRDHQGQRTQTLALGDLLSLVAQYEAAEEQMINTSPYSEAADAVQLMTVFKAKGLEFDHVFLTACQDDVWGSSSRGNSNKLTLPANLAPIRHAGATEGERLRLFFVAITRARYGLHFTGYRHTYTGSATRRLKYLQEVEQDDGSIRSLLLPEAHQTVINEDTEAPAIAAMEQSWQWQSKHLNLTVPLQERLRDRLQAYQLSPTHLLHFIDLEHAGPQSFLINTLLRFPSAPGVDIEFGNAIHETMEWIQSSLNQHGLPPKLEAVLKYFDDRMEGKNLTSEQIAIQLERGHSALTTYLQDEATILTPGNVPEHNFRNEGVLVGDVHMAGKVDLLEIDRENKTITVVDYKTGAPAGSWKPETNRLHKYQLQLYCYKLLIEGSHSYAGYKVEQGKIIFTEPDALGKIRRLNLTFTDAETARVKRLLQAMWARVMSADFPEVPPAAVSLTAIKQFEQELIDRT